MELSQLLRIFLVLLVGLVFWFLGYKSHQGFIPPDEEISSSRAASKILGGVPGRPLHVRGVGFQILAIFLTLFLFLYIFDVISISELKIWFFIILCGVSIFILINDLSKRKKKDI